ncbi:S-layer homology domain-containing protein [Fictibacillus phosphorivorans]|uniref:C40 family peptidase n=1 Tax=Fictibacillus phosphorivorans TaxID=1221500 RepID=UPI003CEEEB65
MKKVVVVFIVSFFLLAFQVPDTKAQSTREKIVSIAKKYQGVNYKWGGVSPSTGFDCSGYTQYVFKEAGLKIPRTADDQFAQGKAVPLNKLQPGDLVFYKNTYPSNGITHVGIYIGNNDFISATSSYGIKVNPLDNVYWSKYYYAAKRIIEDDEQTINQIAPALPIGQFYDVPESYFAHNAIAELSKKGIISGYTGSVFKPGLTITRGQAAIMLNKELQLPATTELKFDDVSPSSAAAYHIAAIERAGIVTGYKDGSFRPNEPITRGQMAIILTKAYKLQNYEAQAFKQFKDVPTSFPTFTEIHALRAHDITQGYQDNTFRPSGKTTRAEFSAFLYRTIN